VAAAKRRGELGIVTFKQAIASGYDPTRYIRDGMKVGDTIELRKYTGDPFRFRESVVYVNLTTAEEVSEYVALVKKRLEEIAKVSS
jgi:hypothetical protein